MQPTDAELRILQVLWDHGPATVRQVQDRLGEEQGSRGYTNYLKLLQNLHEKGLVTRDESGRAHVYQAAVPREPIQRRVLSGVIDKAFGGSAARLVQRAIEIERLSDAEIAEIRARLDDLEKRDER